MVEETANTNNKTKFLGHFIVSLPSVVCETGVHYCDPPTKNVIGKMVATDFWDVVEILLIEHMPKGTTIMENVYKDTIKNMKKDPMILLRKHMANISFQNWKKLLEKAKPNNNKPKSVYSWQVVDVQKWFRRHCSDYFQLYSHLFIQHDITGRTLIRINDNSLLRLGITNAEHREAIWRAILKLRLKTDIIEIRDLQKRCQYEYE